LKRKQLGKSGGKKYQNKLQNKKLFFKVRMRIYGVLVESIFMYNSELWTLTKKLKTEVDVFHRNLLRKILQVRYPIIISNEDLYRKTGEVPWSNQIVKRRLRWTGHLLRLPDCAPPQLAYRESNRYTGKKLRGNKLTWKKQINRYF